MKILIFIVFPVNVMAQPYLTIGDSSSIWSNMYSQMEQMPVPHCSFMDATYYCSKGQDTVINSYSYTKIDSCYGGYKGALRNDNGIVYYVPRDSTQEYTLFDFTVTEGDTLYNIYWEEYWGGVVHFEEIPIHTGAIDSVLIWGSYRKRINLDGAYWIEGVGNTNGLFLNPLNNVSGYCVELACMSVRDSIMYPIESVGSCHLTINSEENKHIQFNVYPNPNKSGVLFVEHNTNELVDYQMLDLQGKIIQSGQLKNNQIDLPDVTGIFMLRLQGSFGIRTERIVMK